MLNVKPVAYLMVDVDTFNGLVYTEKNRENSIFRFISRPLFIFFYGSDQCFPGSLAFVFI